MKNQVLPQEKVPANSTEHLLNEYYRLPRDFRSRFLYPELTGPPGFFTFGPGEICYGRSQSGPTAKTPSPHLDDALAEARIVDHCVHVPFDPAEVIDNLRKERYSGLGGLRRKGFMGSTLARQAYYALREILPFRARRQFQRLYLRGWRDLPFPKWPIDFTVDTLHEHLLRMAMLSLRTQRIPFIWFWPNGARGCLVMTHDVETALGVGFVTNLMDMDDEYGIKSSFQVVPRGRYEFPDALVQEIRRRGFERNVHDLTHDGSLFQGHAQFLSHAARINEHVRAFQSQGFRSGSMYRNQDWFEALEISYDMSVPNAAHLEPQRGGCCTVMPYRIGKILELPLTMTQDYSLFHMLGEYSIDLWKKECKQILERNGLISFIVHPDYVIELRARKVYQDLLAYLAQLRAETKLWAALPRDVNRWWRSRGQMQLVQDGEKWRIEGPDSDLARIAYATQVGDRVTYSLDVPS